MRAYWIADLNARLIERWRPDDVRPEIEGDVLLWQPNPAIPPLRVEMSALFDWPLASDL